MQAVVSLMVSDAAFRMQNVATEDQAVPGWHCCRSSMPSLVLLVAGCQIHATMTLPENPG
jgi:hypothetical protein